MGVLAISEQTASGEPLAPIALRLVVDRAAREDILLSIRRAIPGIGAADGLRAAHALAASRSHPDRVQALHRHLTMASDGTVPDMPSLPDPWAARNHETRVKRSSKGRTTFKRDRLGKARVMGDRYTVAAPYDVDDGLTLAERQHVSADLVALAPSYMHGADAIRLTALTDRHYRGHGVPRLIGIEGEAWATVVPGDRSSRCSVAVHRTDLLGSVVPVDLAHYVPLASVYASHTGKSRTARFPMSRIRLRKVQARMTDPGAVPYVKRDGSNGARFVPTSSLRLATPSETRSDGLGYARCFVDVIRYVMPCDRIVTRWATADGRDHLATLPPETVWFGHECMTRGETSRDKRAATTRKVDAVTIGTFDAPSSLEAWATLLDCINRGERVKVTYPDGTRRTITRGKGGVYSSGSGPARIQARTPDAMALRLS